jgi:coenzyme F420-reducing hydrogenase delta subunit
VAVNVALCDGVIVADVGDTEPMPYPTTALILYVHCTAAGNIETVIVLL